MVAKKEDLIKRAESREAMRSYSHVKDNATVFPEFSMEAVLTAVDNDPTARGALTHFVDKAMEGGHNIIKSSTDKIDTQFMDLLESDYRFNISILRKSLLIGKLFQNVFIEIVRNANGSPKDLNILDSTNIKLDTKPNGDIIKYISKTTDPITNKFPEWKPQEIVHVKFEDRGGNTWSAIDIKALWETLCWKDSMRQFSAWLWKTGQYRVYYNLAEASDDQVKDFLAYTRATNNDRTKPSIFQGKDAIVGMLRDMKENESMIELLKYLDNQILVLLRVAPIDVGVTDSSGRSNSDNQTNSTNTAIKGYKDILADSINYDLFKKMYHGNNKLVWKPIDRFVKKQTFENLNILKNMGMTDEACQEYLQSEGIYFKSATLFNKVEEGMDTPGMKKDIDLMDSRRSSEVKEADVKVGSGEQSSTREDQLRK